MYYDEDLLLDIRLNTLNKYVHKFIITEATYTHNGSQKKLNFDINQFKKFKDKIVYIVVNEPPPNILVPSNNETENKRKERLILNGMARDYFQRENLNKGIQEAQDNDLILISDLDEIPNLSSLNFSEIDDRIILFEQKMFYYKFNLLYENFKWIGSKGIKKKNFLSPQWLRNIKGKNYPKWRLDTLFSNKKYSNITFIKDGGWHFTFIKTPMEIQKKLLNYAHHYEFEESNLQMDDIKKIISDKRVIYDHSIDQREDKWSSNKKLKKISNDFLPKYISDNVNKYGAWLD